MGEGWSDYVACTLNGSAVVGAWVVDRPQGIRSHPYDDAYPRRFGDIASFTDEHDVGEVWAAALLALNREIGVALALQLVIDALKLTPANPSFLDARDAILLALRNQQTGGRLTGQAYTDAYYGTWRVFARFGMGPGARSTGAFLGGVVADTSLPPDVPPGPQREPTPTPTPTPVPAPTQPPPAGTIEVAVEAPVAIPDGDENGVRSTLHIGAAGSVRWIELGVDVAHPYIGDLRVVLVAPDGRQVLLHNRGGTTTQNLVKTWASDKHTGLRALVGMPAVGDWTLWIADLASEDAGSLRRWVLRLQPDAASAPQQTPAPQTPAPQTPAPPRTVGGRARPAATIPDNRPGVTSGIDVKGTGAAKSVKVDVDVTHSFVGDLVVELLAPTGARAVLHDRSGGAGRDLVRSYESGAVPALARLVGTPVKGTWTLRVTDRLARDVGKLNAWGLELGV
jgi:extracellular elastinolytic metalloproteinase